jgi:hypothetical protein
MGGTLKMTKGRALRDTTEVPTSTESGVDGTAPATSLRQRFRRRVSRLWRDK